MSSASLCSPGAVGLTGPPQGAGLGRELAERAPPVGVHYHKMKEHPSHAAPGRGGIFKKHP